MAFLLLIACGGIAAPARPLAPVHLVARWTARGDEVSVLGDRLFVREGRVWRERDLATGAPGITLPMLDYLSRASGSDLFAGRENGPFLVGIGAAGAERWRARCATGDAICQVDGYRIETRIVLVDHLTRTAFALDAATGRELWRIALALDRQMAVHLAADHARLYALARDRAVAIDAASGRILWDRRVDAGLLHPTSRAIAAAGGVVAFAADRKIQILDGVALREDAPVRELAIHGRTLLVLTEAGRLIAIDVATGAIRWERPGGPVVEAGGILYLRGAQGIIAVDPETGAVVATYPVGELRSLHVARGALVAFDGVAVTVLDARAGTATPRMITIRGRIEPATRAPLEVRIGDTVVMSDPDGAFAATVPALGTVVVTFARRIPDPCASAHPVRVDAERWNPNGLVRLIVSVREPCVID